MFKQVQRLTRHLGEVVKETENNTYKVKQDMYFRNGTLSTHPYVERGTVINKQEIEDLSKAYKENRLYFWIP